MGAGPALSSWTSGASARSCGGWPERASRSRSSLPRADADAIVWLDPRAVLIGQRAGGSRSARSTRSRRCVACSAAQPCSACASAISCSGSRSGCGRTSFRSATAARTIRCAFAGPAACSSPSRTTATRSRPRTAPRSSHVSLNDGTVEGLEGDGFFSLQFHPEAAPRPARRRAVLRPDRARTVHAEAQRPTQHPDRRLGPDPHRARMRVRLLRLAGVPRASVRGLSGRARQLEPGDDHDRPRVGRRDVRRALDVEALAAIVEKEHPDALLPTLGGQTALNLAVALGEEGVLDAFGVELIGATSIRSDGPRTGRVSGRDARRRPLRARERRRPLGSRRCRPARAGRRPPGVHPRRLRAGASPKPRRSSARRSRTVSR